MFKIHALMFSVLFFTMGYLTRRQLDYKTHNKDTLVCQHKINEVVIEEVIEDNNDNGFINMYW